MGRKIDRFDVFLVNLDPTIGAEINKARPCVIISPPEIHHLKTCIIAPLTSKVRAFPCRVLVHFNDREGEVALDQIRSIDQLRLIKKIGSLDKRVCVKILSLLREMFEE